MSIDQGNIRFACYNSFMNISNLLIPHKGSEDYARFASWALFGVSLIAIFASIFLSPLKVLGVLVGICTLYVAFWRPDWVLGFLLLYLPFETVLLKFVPDDIYVFARYYSEILVYILCVVVLWRLATHQIRWRFTFMDLPFALFVATLIASSILNLNPAFVAVLGIRQIIRFMLLYFVAVQLRLQPDWIKKLMLGFLCVVGIQLMLGYGQVFIGERLDTWLLPSERKTVGEIELTQGTDYFWDPGQRVFGTLGRYDRLGTFLIPFMLMLLAYLYEVKSIQGRGLYALLILIGALPVLALTYSRASWFAFVLGALFISWIVHKDKRIAYGLGLGAVMILIYVALSGLVVSRLVDVPSQTIIYRLLEAFSVERWYGEYYGLGRLYWIVQTVTSVFPASPLFGHGPGVFGGGTVSALQYTEVYDNLGLPFGIFGTQGMIDNNWMSLLGETGLLGLGIYIWMYIGLFWLLRDRIRLVHHPILRAFVIGVMAILPGYMMIAFLGTYLEVRTVAAYLWTFAGIATTLVLYPSKKDITV